MVCRRRLCRLPLIVLVIAVNAAAMAQDAPPPATKDAATVGKSVDQPDAGSSRSSAEAQSTSDAPQPTDDASATGEADKCNWDTGGDEPIQEEARDALRGATCHSFRWFDSLFGHMVDFPENQVRGLMVLGGKYTQYDKFDPRLRLRVRAELPNMSRRWDLIVGRLDERAYISDTQSQDQTFYNPGTVQRSDQEDSWLLGLGNRREVGRSGWDYSVGVRLRTPLVPYAKVQYLQYLTISGRTDLRFRQTFFWRRDDGWGTTSRGDLSFEIGPRNVLRWEGVGTVSEATLGTEWYVGQTWYHLLGDQYAFSLLAFANGETNAEVPLKEYGLNAIWRRPFTRDWIFISYGPSITWPRYFRSETRQLSLGFGAWIEMEFGGWEY